MTGNGPIRTQAAVAILTGFILSVWPVAAQDGAAILQKIDAATQARYEHVLGFSDTEHYAVYRGAEQTHPAAEMTVRVTYRKGVGKSYKVLSQSGSALIQHFGLKPLIENEQEINDPAKVADSWFTTANYVMRVEAGQTRMLEGRTCVGVSIKPKRSAPNMIDGTVWVDPENGAILEVEGIASKAPSIFAGTTHMMRQYAMMDGYAQATHALAESSGMFGRTVVKIEYSDYKIEVK
ncbi:MAG TPA: hypothetical protein VMU71_01825 [Terracidiphilus sp.]|nr:hypothetical protein [Terracidiphilus sp.]